VAAGTGLEKQTILEWLTIWDAIQAAYVKQFNRMPTPTEIVHEYEVDRGILPTPAVPGPVVEQRDPAKCIRTPFGLYRPQVKPATERKMADLTVQEFLDLMSQILGLSRLSARASAGGPTLIPRKELGRLPRLPTTRGRPGRSRDRAEAIMGAVTIMAERRHFCRMEGRRRPPGVDALLRKSKCVQPVIEVGPAIHSIVGRSSTAHEYQDEQSAKSGQRLELMADRPGVGRR